MSSVNSDYPPPDEPDWQRAFEALEALYEDVARQLPRYEFTCSASGNCCDFDAYGHRLYATTLEAEYFFRHETTQHVNDDPKQCPAWGHDRLCKAREGRLLGCRTYFCPPYPNGTPEEVHEGYMGKLKSIHERFGIESSPWMYARGEGRRGLPARSPGERRRRPRMRGDALGIGH